MAAENPSSFPGAELLQQGSGPTAVFLSKIDSPRDLVKQQISAESALSYMEILEQKHVNKLKVILGWRAAVLYDNDRFPKLEAVASEDDEIKLKDLPLLRIPIPEERAIGKQDSDIFLTPSGSLQMCRVTTGTGRNLVDWDSRREATGFEYINYTPLAIKEILATHERAIERKQVPG